MASEDFEREMSAVRDAQAHIAVFFARFRDAAPGIDDVLELLRSGEPRVRGSLADLEHLLRDGLSYHAVPQGFRPLPSTSCSACDGNSRRVWRPQRRRPRAAR